MLQLVEELLGLLLAVLLHLGSQQLALHHPVALVAKILMHNSLYGGVGDMQLARQGPHGDGGVLIHHLLNKLHKLPAAAVGGLLEVNLMVLPGDDSLHVIVRVL